MVIKNNKSKTELVAHTEQDDKIYFNAGALTGPKASKYKFNTTSLPIMGTNLQTEIKADKSVDVSVNNKVQEFFTKSVARQLGLEIGADNDGDNGGNYIPPLEDDIRFNFVYANYDSEQFAVREINDKVYAPVRDDDRDNANFIEPLALCATLTITEEDISEFNSNNNGGFEIIPGEYKGLCYISSANSWIYFDNIGTVNVSEDKELALYSMADEIDGKPNTYTVKSGINKVSLILDGKNTSRWECNLVIGNHPMPTVYYAVFDDIVIDIEAGSGYYVVKQLDNKDTRNATYNDILVYTFSDKFADVYKEFGMPDETVAFYRIARRAGWYGSSTYKWVLENNPENISSCTFSTILGDSTSVSPTENGGFANIQLSD